jgi:hypothetical protein
MTLCLLLTCSYTLCLLFDSSYTFKIFRHSPDQEPFLIMTSPAFDARCVNALRADFIPRVQSETSFFVFSNVRSLYPRCDSISNMNFVSHTTARGVNICSQYACTFHFYILRSSRTPRDRAPTALRRLPLLPHLAPLSAHSISSRPTALLTTSNRSRGALRRRQELIRARCRAMRLW